jgi:hypothetical protein
MTGSAASARSVPVTVLTVLAAVALTVAAIPIPFGPLAVGLLLIAARSAVRRHGGPLAESVARALLAAALLAILVGLALAASYGTGAEPESPVPRSVELSP